jgi:hypothetical protein
MRIIVDDRGVISDNPTDPTTFTFNVPAYGSDGHQLASQGYVDSTTLRYWVSPSGSTLTTNFTSIQAANDDAVRLGHGPTKPTVVFLLPGTYNENVVLSDGISLYGFNIPDSIGSTIVSGSLTTNATYLFTMVNIFVKGAVTLGTGSMSASYVLRDVTIQPALNNLVPLTINNPSGKFLFSGLIADSTYTNTNAVNISSSLGEIVLEDCDFIAASSKKSFHVSGAISSFQAEDTTFTGQIAYSAGAVTASYSNCEFFTTPGVAAISSTSGSNTLLHVCTANGMAVGDRLITGSGSMIFDSLSGINAFTIDPSINSLAYSVQKAYTTDSHLLSSSITLTSLADMERVSGVGGSTFTCYLPSSNTIPQGTRTVIRNVALTSSVMTLAVASGSSDNIDGVSSVTIVPPANSVMLQLSGTTWTTFSKA